MTLRDAAEELFDIRDVCDEFHDLTEARKGQAVLRQLSERARCLQADKGRAAMFPWQLDPATVWLNAHIADCLLQAERIASEIREGP